MVGGRGSDVYFVNTAGDVVRERAVDTGTDKIVTTLTTTLSANIEDGTLLGVASAADLTGNASSNTLRGNQNANKLDGLDGHDNLFGGAGNDTLLGGMGNDALNGGMGNDTLNGGDGTDSVDFSNLGVAITLDLSNAAAQATGAGSDTITNCENATGGMWDDKLTGNSGANNLAGNYGNDTLIGQAGNDYLYGGSGNDNLQGGADIDYLSGDAGDDKFFGGAGVDVYYGSTGADTFYFDVKEVAGFDSVSDFVSGEDKIAIDQSAFGGIGNGDTTINNAVTKYGAGGFGTGAEMVIFTHGYLASNTNPTTADAAAAIGSASAAYAAGDDRLFVLDNGGYGHLYLFHSANANALVEAAELQLIGILTNAPDTVLSDYLFVA
jgi:Ca2+-binding RTX toxin-like protein